MRTASTRRQNGGDGCHDLLREAHDDDRLAGRDVGKVSWVTRLHGPLLKLLKVETADLRAKGVRLERHEDREVVRLSERDAGVYERGLERLLSSLLRMETSHARWQLGIGQQQAGSGEVVVRELQPLVRIRLLGHSPADTPIDLHEPASTGSSRRRPGGRPTRPGR